MSNLNPVAKIGTQVAETLLAHGLANRQNVRAQGRRGARPPRACPTPRSAAKQYPHEFSGGMRQRALIAIGLACKPRLLIADEPTSALDVTVQQTILDQIGAMTRELGTAVLLITHDLGLAAERAERVIVMHRGKVVEQGPAQADPRGSAASVHAVAGGGGAVGRRRAPAPRGVPRRSTAPVGERAGGGEPVERAERADSQAPATTSSRSRTSRRCTRCGAEARTSSPSKDVSLAIPRGETVAIVGESGSGKTTTARMLLKVIEPTSGLITLRRQGRLEARRAETRDFRQQVQPIFQDPYSSLNPMFTIERLIAEPLDFYKRGSGPTGASACGSCSTTSPCRSRCCGGTRPSCPAVSASASRSPGRSRSRRTDRVRRAGLGARRAGAGSDPDAAAATCSGSTA